MARPKVLSFPWISKGFHALTFGLWRVEKQKAFSACPSPSKGLIGAFEEAVKGDPWRTGPTAADLASANYRAKALERENATLREALETIAEEHDAGRHDGLPEPCPANDADMMFAVARRALQTVGHARAAARVIAQIEGSAP